MLARKPLFFAALMLVFTAPFAQAAFVISPGTVVDTTFTPQLPFANQSPNFFVDQSGLSAPYNSGVTDFATYTGSATHATFGSNTSFLAGQTAGTIDLDLGSVFTLTDLALFVNSADNNVATFQVFSSPNNTFSSLTPILSLGPPVDAVFTATNFNSGGTPLNPEVFPFSSPIDTQFVRLEILSTHQGAGGSEVDLLEVAFHGSPPAVVPTPSAMLLMGSGLLGLVGWRWWSTKRI